MATDSSDDYYALLSFRLRRRRFQRDRIGYNGFSMFTTRMGYLNAELVEGSTAVTR